MINKTLNKLTQNLTKNKKVIMFLVALAIVGVVGFMMIENNKIPEVNTPANVKESFQNEVNLKPKGDEKLVVLFYTNWCGYCQKFKPSFKNAMKKVNGMNNGTRLVMVDCEENKNLAKKYDINGYPTVMLLTNNSEEVLPTPDRSKEGFLQQVMNL